MKRVFISLFITAGLVLPSIQGLSWGREGHETIAKLAEMNLNGKTKKIVEKYLGGHSIVYVAKWADDIRKTPEFRRTSDWHSVLVDSTFQYTPRENREDVIIGLKEVLFNLSNYKNLPDSVVALNLRFLIHVVGDMHCPAHLDYVGKSQKYNVSLEDEYHNYINCGFHMLWDVAVIQANRYMCATEWAAELNRVLSKEDKKKMAQGTIMDWLSDSAERCSGQFDLAPVDAKLSSAFVVVAMPLIEEQISYGGIRLASLLNTIFK